MKTTACPALLIAAPASGHGKTTFTAALARYHARRGRKVRVFKTGPDFLDPMILERASGHPVYQLDGWMGSGPHCRDLLFQAASEADLILVEGAMGLFDGSPSSADLAQQFGLPVAAVIDASAMAQTFGAIAGGLARHRGELAFAGVIANRIAGERHADLVREGMPHDVPCLATLHRNPDAALPSRHLGLVQADELEDLDARLDAAADALRGTGLGALPPPVQFDEGSDSSAMSLALKQVRVGVARDAAFSFIYPANLDTLKSLGAELRFFSPLDDHELPEVDALWFPGGYPELHLGTLEANRSMRDAVRAHWETGKPILAECGGMLYLGESLTATDGRRAGMCGLLHGHAIMQQRLAALGMQSVSLPEGDLRGHTFHHSRLENAGAPAFRARRQDGTQGEAIYRSRGLTASYMHFYFPSNPEAAAAFFAPGERE